MAQVQVHRCRFLDYARPYVTSLEFNHRSPGSKTLPSSDLRLAVGRSNGDIEIWNPRRWSLDTTLLGARDRSIEDVAWSYDSEQFRLFSVGGSDALTEWDLETGQPRGHFRSDFGVIWAVEPSPDGKQLAVACETGTIVIFDISGGPGSVEYVKRLQPADASLACLAWKNSEQVVAGGADARIRIWNVNSSRIIGTMKVDKSKLAEGTVVWTVKVLQNRGEQIVSGDSNGYLKIWDGKTLTLQQSFQAHEGDVLCLGIDVSGSAIFSSGLDQKIVCTRLTDPKHRRWTVMSSRVTNSHDIRAMAIYEAKAASYLVTGGLESTFVVGSVDKFESRPHRKIPLSRPRPTSAIYDNTLVEWRENTVNLWKLDANGKRLILRINSAEDPYITGVALRESLLAVATSNQVKLFEIQAGGSDGKITAVRALKPQSLDGVGARMIQFSRDRLVIVPVDPSDPLVVYNVATETISEIDEPVDLRRTTSSLGYMNTPMLMAVDDRGDLLALAKSNRFIELYSIRKLSHVASLPSVGDTPVAISFLPKTGSLAVVTADNNVYEFDTKAQSLTMWSREHSGRLPALLTGQADVACGVFTDRDTPSRIWVWGPSWLAFLDTSKSLPGIPRSKRRNSVSESEFSEDDVEPEAEPNGGFWLTRYYQPLFYAGMLGADLLVAEKPAEAAEIRPFSSNRHIRL